MSRTLGTVVRGVRAPIFREGDNVVDITVSTVLNALQDNAITARDGDVVAVTSCCGASRWARRRWCCC